MRSKRNCTDSAMARVHPSVHSAWPALSDLSDSRLIPV